MQKLEKVKPWSDRIFTKYHIHGFGKSGKSRVSSQRHIQTSSGPGYPGLLLLVTSLACQDFYWVSRKQRKTLAFLIVAELADR
jgi:hypothetical protein